MLILHQTPKPFDGDNIHPSTLAIQTDLNAVRFQGAGEGLAGKLMALIGVEDLGFAVVSD